MDENNYRRFQAATRIITMVGAVVVFFVGIQRYHAEQEDLIRTRIEAEQQIRDREFRRELWLRQLDVLSSIAGAASRIAVVAEGDADAFAEAVQEYEQLYWANVTFIESPDLVQAMDALRHEIRYFQDGFEPTGGLSAPDKIKQRAHRVALACRRAIREGGREFIQLEDDAER